MNLTPAQIATLKSFIMNDGTLGPKATSGDYDFVANALNANATPDFWCWKTSIVPVDLMTDPTFDWTRVDNLTIGKARIWEEMISLGVINPSQANIRAGFSATWSAAGDAATLAGILVNCRRKTTVVEKVLATGTGSIASPATFGAQGFVGAGDIGGIIS